METCNMYESDMLKVETSETRQFGTKTFRHPLKKTVRHQESSVSGQIGTAFSFKQT